MPAVRTWKAGGTEDDDPHMKLWLLTRSSSLLESLSFHLTRYARRGESWNVMPAVLNVARRQEQRSEDPEHA